MKHQQLALLQNDSFNKTNMGNMNSANYYYYTISTPPKIFGDKEDISSKLLITRPRAPSFSSNIVQCHDCQRVLCNVNSIFSTLVRSLIRIFSFPNVLVPISKLLFLPSYLALTQTLGRRKVTGTLFGYRRGHVSFAVQDDPRSDPILVIELAMSTSTLVKEMSSGLVRIALECKKVRGSVRPGSKQNRTKQLYSEPTWMMYCNGRKCGYATTRACTRLDLHMLATIQTVSVGAGVIPMVENGEKGNGWSEGELLFMRARFERVIGSRDSEAFYMMNPDGSGGPELGIFLLRM